MESKQLTTIELSKWDISNAMASLNHDSEWALKMSDFSYIKEHYKVNPVIDCCGTIINKKCPTVITKEMDLFKQEIKLANYMNPVYYKSIPSKGIKGVDRFVEYQYLQHVKYNTEMTTLLGSFTTSSAWYQRFFGESDINAFGEKVECHKFPKRIRFINDEGKKKKSPPFSSLVLVIRPKPESEIESIRRKVFGDGGLSNYT